MDIILLKFLSEILLFFAVIFAFIESSSLKAAWGGELISLSTPGYIGLGFASLATIINVGLMLAVPIPTFIFALFILSNIYGCLLWVLWRHTDFRKTRFQNHESRLTKLEYPNPNKIHELENKVKEIEHKLNKEKS